MRSDKSVSGRILQSEKPHWTPLLNLAPEHIDDFMWMFEAELQGGVRLHAYKHYWTRRYIHLTCDGRAFAYLENGRYRQMPPCRLLKLALRREPA